MTTIGEALAGARRRLAAAGIDGAALEARVLLAHVLDEPQARLVGWPERNVPIDRLEWFERLVARRTRREPVAYIVGCREFWGLEFRVTPATLVPRPDTETLVATALAVLGGRRAPARLLDIGTGSGCILIALLHEVPDATGIGVDPSPEALAVARDNAERLGVAPRARWASTLAGVDDPRGFDVVVANLPYIPSAEIARLDPDLRDFEPRAALDGGPDGLAVMREAVAELPRLLAPEGLALFEIGIGQAPELEAIFVATGGLRPAGRWTDLAGVERVLGARRNPA